MRPRRCNSFSTFCRARFGSQVCVADLRTNKWDEEFERVTCTVPTFSQATEGQGAPAPIAQYQCQLTVFGQFLCVKDGDNDPVPVPFTLPLRTGVVNPETGLIAVPSEENLSPRCARPFTLPSSADCCSWSLAQVAPLTFQQHTRLSASKYNFRGQAGVPSASKC